MDKIKPIIDEINQFPERFRFRDGSKLERFGSHLGADYAKRNMALSTCFYPIFVIKNCYPISLDENLRFSGLDKECDFDLIRVKE